MPQLAPQLCPSLLAPPFAPALPQPLPFASAFASAFALLLLLLPQPLAQPRCLPWRDSESSRWFLGCALALQWRYPGSGPLFIWAARRIEIPPGVQDASPPPLQIFAAAIKTVSSVGPQSQYGTFSVIPTGVGAFTCRRLGAWRSPVAKPGVASCHQSPDCPLD